MSWSQLEQEQLDKALVFTRDAAGAYGNAKERWTAIAEMIPGKSIKECILRYKEIRDALSNQSQGGADGSGGGAAAEGSGGDGGGGSAASGRAGVVGATNHGRGGKVWSEVRPTIPASVAPSPSDVRAPTAEPAKTSKGKPQCSVPAASEARRPPNPPKDGGEKSVNALASQMNKFNDQRPKKVLGAKPEWADDEQDQVLSCGGLTIVDASMPFTRPERAPAGKLQSAKAQQPAKGSKAWWKSIQDDDPISLERICELSYPPFQLDSCYFDGKVLAHFLVSTANFINPMNRRPLLRDECLLLDRYTLS
jgi:hypothetical protein